MSQSQTGESDENLPNYKCQVCGAVWPNPIVATRHIFNSGIGNHGEEGMVPRGLMPSPTEQEVDSDTLEDYIEEDLRNTLGEDDILIDVQENFEGDVPPVLSEHDLETFSLLQMDSEILADLKRVNNNLVKIQTGLSAVMEDAGAISGGAVQTPEPVPDTDDGEEESEDAGDIADIDDDALQGRVTTAERMDAERTEVMKVLKRIRALDDWGQQGYQCFEEVYKRRDETGNVDIPTVSNQVGVSESDAEKMLDDMTEMGLLDYDSSTDSYYYPY